MTASVLLAAVLMTSAQQRMLLNQPAKSSAPSFNPSQISGASLYLSSHDLPANAFFFGWTNDLNTSQIFTNVGTTYPANTASGVQFDGTSGNYLLDATCPTTFSNTVDSLWVRLIISSYASYRAIIATKSFSGQGLSTFGTSVILDQGQVLTVAPAVPTSSVCDILIPANATTVQCYTNGVAADSFSPFTAINSTIWGIGHDNGGDPNFVGYIQSVFICTNHSLTLSEANSISNYANSH